MGKETQLLEAASAGNNVKVEQLLKGQSKLKRFLSREMIDVDNEEDSSSLVIKEKKQSTSVNVNYKDESGATALMLAALNGHKAVIHTLIQYSSEVFTMDNQGNTALHYAAWHNRTDIIELLLANGAMADIANRQGNTPLHYASQYCPTGKTFTVNKLLQQDCNVLVPNLEGDSPFNLAVRFNKIDAVSLLVDANPATLKQAKPIIEAARNGRKEIILILLDAGMDPNFFEQTTGTFPLHEAVRFFRNDVAQLLLEFGAEPDQQGMKGETAISIARQHPASKRDEFLTMFVNQRGKPARIPKSSQTPSSSPAHQSTDLYITYPLLKNNPDWCQAGPEYCSAWTKQHPPTCLLDNDSCSFWKIPAAGAYNWVAFDMRSEYTLTGIRIAGWDNQQMVHNFFIECSSTSLSGPWKQVQKFTADCVGSEDMFEPSDTQDFKGFYETAQYWKLVFADNYGDPTTCLSELQFFGVEKSVVVWFEKLELQQYLKNFVLRGYNQLSELASLTSRDFQDIVTDAGHCRQLLEGVSQLKKMYCKPKNLWWDIPPTTKATSDKPLPEISVQSNAYAVGDLALTVVGGGRLRGKTIQSLVAKENGYKSRAVFKGLILETPGQFVLEVHYVSDPSVCLRSNAMITVVPPPMKQSELGEVFDDFDKMLQFDF